MYCSRCHGRMRKDHFLDMEGGFGEMWAQSWRCMNCGAVYDAVIEQNRRARQENVLVLSDGQPEDQEDDEFLGGEAFPDLAA